MNVIGVLNTWWGNKACVNNEGYGAHQSPSLFTQLLFFVWSADLIVSMPLK